MTRTSATVWTWAYPNIRGDVTYTIDQSGAKTGPFLYDPYGQPLTGVTNTSPGDMDNGWLGQHQRPTEHQPELRSTIEMGARPYRADLGRFLREDPIPGGATDSNYGYVYDPINSFDLSGERCWLGVARREVVTYTDSSGRSRTKTKEHCRTPRSAAAQKTKGMRNAVRNVVSAAWTASLAPGAKWCDGVVAGGSEAGANFKRAGELVRDSCVSNAISSAYGGVVGAVVSSTSKIIGAVKWATVPGVVVACSKNFVLKDW